MNSITFVFKKGYEGMIEFEKLTKNNSNILNLMKIKGEMHICVVYGSGYFNDSVHFSTMFNNHIIYPKFVLIFQAFTILRINLIT